MHGLSLGLAALGAYGCPQWMSQAVVSTNTWVSVTFTASQTVLTGSPATSDLSSEALWHLDVSLLDPLTPAAAAACLQRKHRMDKAKICFQLKSVAWPSGSAAAVVSEHLAG